MEIRQKTNPVRGPYRSSYDIDDLQRAFMAVKDNQMSIRKSALYFNVPKTTLIDRLHGRISIGTVKPGPDPLFTLDQESLLASHIQTMGEVGFGYTRQETINLASDYAFTLGLRPREKPLTDRWLYKFLDRWPELMVKKTRSLDIARARCATRDAVDRYFNKLHETLVKYDLLSKPHRLYNIDEKGLSLEHKPPKIVSSKHGTTPAVTGSRGKNVTVIGCVNGVGQQVPPYFVFPGQRMQPSLLDGVTPGTNGTVSPTGWSNSEVFSGYLKEHVLQYLPLRSQNEPVLILYDGHSSHISLDLIQWAKQEDIILFVLTPHCSHLLQPLDVSCFGPFEVAWNAALHSNLRASGGRTLSRYDVASLACKVYSSTLTATNIQAAFRKSGVYPFNKNVISDHQVAPSTCFHVTAAGDACSKGSEPLEDNEKADQFLQERGGKILQNVDTAKKLRNTLSKVVGGQAVTETEVLNKIQTYKHNQSNKRSKDANKENINPRPSVSGCAKKPKVIRTVTESDTCSSEEDITDSEKCIVCKKFSPDLSKRPYIVIVKWGQCDKCSGWVHLSFCTTIRVIRRGDNFLCPQCSTN
ncbi:uncharacterized protein LOC127862643 [Dreissena polymorpha]|uniref:uncharacterized protein LOC127862643 n=1 Tax=Dreissena polymorpha TaxID=45954 RepID=UPI0022653721|nr:uncharacterized protein LOC127862643 [Dreissena polymorpha]